MICRRPPQEWPSVAARAASGPLCISPVSCKYRIDCPCCNESSSRSQRVPLLSLGSKQVLCQMAWVCQRLCRGMPSPLRCSNEMMAEKYPRLLFSRILHGNCARTDRSGCLHGRRADPITAIAPNSHGPVAVRRLWRTLLLPRRPVGRNAASGRSPGAARRQPRRRHHSNGRDRVIWRAGLRARQIVLRRTRRLLGRPGQFPHRLGRRDRVHADVRLRVEPAAIQHRVDRQPPDAIALVGGFDQSVVEMVRLFVLRNDHRHLEHQLSRRRRRGAAPCFTSPRRSSVYSWPSIFCFYESRVSRRDLSRPHPIRSICLRVPSRGPNH